MRSSHRVARTRHCVCAKTGRGVPHAGTANRRPGGTTDGFVPSGVPSYVASALRSFGYWTKLHLVPATTISPALRDRFQISVDGDWLPQYPRPSAYLPQFFGCHGGWRTATSATRTLDREMQKADALQLTDPRQAAELWRRIDHEIVDQACWLTTVNGHESEFVSKRLRNYQYSPVGDFIADQVRLR
jgi:ABC-type transport system substrate-binding protein